MLKQNKISTIVIVLLLSLRLMGQNEPSSKNEQLRLHISQQVLFSGETLCLSIHSSGLPKPNSFSSLAYIELINKNDASIVRKKVQLNSGHGNNYIQLPDTLSSGIYTLVAYTRWMKNYGKQSFYQKAITVINPDKSFKEQAKNTTKKKVQNDHTNTTVLSKRQKVLLQEIRTENNLKKGSYSIAIKRKEPFISSSEENKEQPVGPLSKVQYLPDYKGIIVSGKLYDSNNKTINKEEILLSLPGEKTDLHSVVSNENGSFHFKLAAKTGNTDLVFTLPNSEMKIKLDDPFVAKHNISNSSDLLLTDKQLQFLQEKYLYHQLNKKFGFSAFAKNEATQSDYVQQAFYTKVNRTIHTANYVKLDSISEYFYELIPSVQFRQVKGDYKINITRQEGKIDLGPNPGVFVDGVYFSEYDNIAKLPVEKIDRIEVIWEKYFYKDFSFDGIVSIYTRKADFYSIDLQENMSRIIYPLADEEEYQFLKKKYNEKNQTSRIPDLRYLLLWEPHTTSDQINKLEFFTSDVPGNYEISICGYSNNGQWHEEKHLFEVE